MNTIKEDFTNEDILTALYKLASIGAAKSLNVDLMKLEELSGRKLSLSAISVLAMAGANTDDEREFVKVCESVLVKEEQCN
jgi:hypothetical protein